MSVSMYTVSIPVFMQHLNGLSGVLDKAAAWAAARKVSEADLLNMRLSPDMFNLARQIRAAGLQHLDDRRRIEERQQQMLDGNEFVPFLAGALEGFVQAILELAR